MADWSSQNITLTAKGASALSKVQAGSGSLTITKVVASEQYVAESTLREVTSLSVENLPLTIIDRYEVQDEGSVIQVQLSNLYLGKAFTLNEIGVFATHSDNPSEEFLYIIAQVDAETGDKIPVYATTPVTATYDIYLYNVGADNVQITISSAGLVTYEALNKACDIIQRNTAYEVGDILHSHSLKKGLAIKCTVAGITKSTDTDLSHKNVGDTVEDGTSQWVVIAPSTTADFDAHNHSVDAHPELMKQLIESGLNVIKRSHSYAKGDIAYSDKIPSWAFLECIVAGTTSDGWYFPEPSEIKVGDTIVDYTVTWKVHKVADTASKLATARNIALTGKATGSATFDGSANASINVTSVNADTASKLSTARKINITGNATGSTSFDGSGDVNISTTVNESKHATAADNDGAGNNIANTYFKNSGGTVTGTVNLKNGLTSTGAIYINPNTTSYNEDIRLNEGTNKWATIYIGAPLNSTSGSAPNAWGISRLPEGQLDFFKGGTWSALSTGLRLNGDGTALLGGKEVVKNTGTWDINISGNATSATNADTVDGYHASDLLGKIYPVGSIYMSMSATNPADLFGVGTWERISQGRMLLGADDSTYKAGATGGEATHTLTAAEMPAHSHTGTTSMDGNHSHGVRDSDNLDGYGNSFDSGDHSPQGYIQTTNAGNHNHTFTTNNTGGGAAHNNMSPYLVCYIWQRTA